jgi:hypothetical protein
MSDTVGDILPRVAVLEQIARSTTAALERIERRLDSVASEQRSDFRWLLGILLGGFGMTVGGFASLLLVLAHGFHWL